VQGDADVNRQISNDRSGFANRRRMMDYPEGISLKLT